MAFSRWVPAATMLLVSLISYIDRNTLALLAPTILKETGLSGEDYGFVISAFSIAYMIGNPLWGRALDRVGLRHGMMAAVSLWTLASISHAFAAGFWTFAAARAALGFGEGATFPGGLRAAMQTLPPSQQSRGIAVAYSGGSLGAIVTPIIVTPVALWFGWRGAFWFTGVIGLGWIALWAVISRRPDIREHRRAPAAEPPKSAPSFRDRRLWAFMIAYAFCALPLGFVLYNASIYLDQSWHKSQAEIGKLLWIPPLGWEAGYFFWGWLSDRKTASLGRLMTIAAVCSAPLALTPWAPALWIVMLELFFAMFFAGGFVILTIAYATRTYSGSHAGLIAGLGAGSWSACVALVMPVFGRLFDQRRPDLAFLLAAAFPIIGYAAWLALGRTSAIGRR